MVTMGKKKNTAPIHVGPQMGHCKLYLKCTLNECNVIAKLINWNKIVDDKPHPKRGEHYSMVPWLIQYQSCRLPPPGKWFLVAITDSEAGFRRQGIRHFYVTQEDSVKDLPGIDDLQAECDEILQYTRTYVIGEELTCKPPSEAVLKKAKKMKKKKKRQLSDSGQMVIGGRPEGMEGAIAAAAIHGSPTPGP